MKKTTEQLNASQVFCPNVDCVTRGKIGQGNIIIHGRSRPRYRCKMCRKTFSANAGTMFDGLRKPKSLVVIEQEGTVKKCMRRWSNKEGSIWCMCRPTRSGSRDDQWSCGWAWQ